MNDAFLSWIISSSALVVMYILWADTYSRLRSAERYIFIENDGKMEEYNEFRKHF